MWKNARLAGKRRLYPWIIRTICGGRWSWPPRPGRRATCPWAASSSGTGRNRREENGDATAHAELEAIRDACRRLGSWRLHRCTMYVTLEPCPMCAGGIINARVDTVRYGTRDDKAGACGSVLNLFEERFNHHPRLYRGPLERECQEILQDFFQGLREDGAGENG